MKRLLMAMVLCLVCAVSFNVFGDVVENPPIMETPVDVPSEDVKTDTCIILYPLNDVVLHNAEGELVCVFDVGGRFIDERLVECDKVSLNVYPPGIYIVYVKRESKVFIIK